MIGPSCVSVIDHPVTMTPVAPREVRNSVPASLGFLPHNHNVFAACHTRLDPKGVCCPQALAILAGADDRSGPERIKGRFLWVFRDRPTKSTAGPQAERLAVTVDVSEGRSPGASRMPRPITILAAEGQPGQQVSPIREQNVALGVTPTAGSPGNIRQRALCLSCRVSLSYVNGTSASCQRLESF